MRLIFAHNGHNRPNTLRETIDTSKKHFPGSQHFISITNDGGLQAHLGLFPDVNVIPTNGVGWQLGSVNCFYSVVSHICSVYDDGVIVFSHDDVRICDPEQVRKNIDRISDESLSYICRNPGSPWGDAYLMMEAVYLNIGHVKSRFTPFSSELLNGEHLLPLDNRGCLSAESWLYNMLGDSRNGLVITYPHRQWSQDEINNHLGSSMGFVHLNFGHTGWTE